MNATEKGKLSRIDGGRESMDDFRKRAHAEIDAIEADEMIVVLRGDDSELITVQSNRLSRERIVWLLLRAQQITMGDVVKA